MYIFRNKHAEIFDVHETMRQTFRYTSARFAPCLCWRAWEGAAVMAPCRNPDSVFVAGCVEAGSVALLPFPLSHAQ